MFRAHLKFLASIFLAAVFCSGPALAQDGDGDGSPKSVDCDDSDASRYPGNTEVADRDGHDEDCNPATFGEEDADGDGFIADWACNYDSGGRAYCGEDCDDLSAEIHPLQIDICNRRDDNCDGDIDEHQPCTTLLDVIEEAQTAQAERRKERRVTDLTKDTREGLSGGVEGATDLPGVGQPSSGGNDRACANAVQGEIAWNYNGTTQWGSSNVNRLCQGAETTTEPAECFEEAMHGQTDTGDGSTRWRWQDALELCKGTRSADDAIACYKDEIGRGRSQAQAIDACSGQY